MNWVQISNVTFQSLACPGTSPSSEHDPSLPQTTWAEPRPDALDLNGLSEILALGQLASVQWKLNAQQKASHNTRITAGFLPLSAAEPTCPFLLRCQPRTLQVLGRWLWAGEQAAQVGGRDDIRKGEISAFMPSLLTREPAIILLFFRSQKTTATVFSTFRSSTRCFSLIISITFSASQLSVLAFCYLTKEGTEV